MKSNIVIIDFMKVSINCFLEKDIFPVRSLIQCARKCAAQNECDGLQLHSLLNTSATGNCLENEVCDGGNLTAECVFLIRSEFLEAKQYQENTVIIAKHGRIKPQVSVLMSNKEVIIIIDI